MDSNEIRKRFLDFYAARGHTVVESSSLIPNDPSLLLTAAGMVQFKPYLLGVERPPYQRAASVQKCARTTDIDVVGTTLRHLTFFEMLGNFSLGDYFKEKAIPWGWELVTEHYEIDPDLVWVTVHETDDEAAGIWLDVVGLDPDRLQRMGADNFWSMGTAGPCGPSSEIFVDKGPAFGDPGGPAVDDERYVEIYNLVFMQNQRDDAGNIVGDLPNKNIDTGAGLERVALAINGLRSVFETDTIRPVLAVGEEMAGVDYGHDAKADVSLRILADHGRSATFLVADGVFPSNEDRGYVLRRILRRAIRHAWLLGIEDAILPRLAGRVCEIMQDTYPELARNADTTRGILENEEERFRQTLKAGMGHLESAFDTQVEGDVLSGAVAFKLHDTFGFPIELTQEIAAERNVGVDLHDFELCMDEQRSRSAGEAGEVEAKTADVYPTIVDEIGKTSFLGYETTAAEAEIGALVVDGRRVDEATAGTDVEVFADRSPFYAESGGQVGDTGVIELDAARLDVGDTQYGVPGLISHRARIADGTIRVGDTARFEVDVERRAGIRKHHTGTHILHWALRELLGDHVRQQGSIVLPNRLRFDFSHYSALTPDEVEAVEDLANREVLSNKAVLNYETTKAEADSRGVISFFGEKYGDIVRVLEAGEHSKELCGGTHVSTLGEIGPIVIISESSIGSNLRRIEALCGAPAIEYMRGRRHILDATAQILQTAPEDVPEALGRRLDDAADTKKQLDGLRSQIATGRADELAAQSFDLDGGAQAVVVRVDGIDNAKELQRLASEVRAKLAPAAAVLGADVQGKASLVAAVSKELQVQGLSAAEAVRDAAGVVGGGTGRNPDLAMAGGPKGGAVDDALEAARAFLTRWSPASADETDGRPDAR